MKIAVVTFPGSNCDADSVYFFEHFVGTKARLVFHKDREEFRDDAVIVPGGFTFGDYLRAGAVAARLPILDDVKRFISRGGWVLGICNGFQILTEAGFLPGALDVNRYKHFLCKTVRLRAERTEQPWIPPLMRGSEWVFPMANGQGRYCADTALEKKLDETGSVAFRYVDHDNGSTGRIAGVNDRALGGTGRVLGLMPHPERNPEEGKRWFRLWLETVGAV